MPLGEECRETVCQISQGITYSPREDSIVVTITLLLSTFPTYMFPLRKKMWNGFERDWMLMQEWKKMMEFKVPISCALQYDLNSLHVCISDYLSTLFFLSHIDTDLSDFIDPEEERKLDEKDQEEPEEPSPDNDVESDDEGMNDLIKGTNSLLSVG